MVLTACVVFLLVVIGAGEFQRMTKSADNDGEASVAETSPAPDRRDSLEPAAESMISRTVSNQPGSAWLETDGTVTGKVPV